MNVGEELVDRHARESKYEFQCVDEGKAQDGLKNGQYYMIISIPEDFSKNATNAFRSTTTKDETSIYNKSRK